MDPQDTSQSKNSAYESKSQEMEMKRLHQQYIQEKMNRKKEMRLLIRAEMGSSSESDDEDFKILSDPIVNPIVNPRKQQSNERIFVITPSKKNNEWVKDQLIIAENKLILQNYSYEVKSISRIRVVSEPISSSPFRIKMSYFHSQICCAAEGKVNNYQILGLVLKQRLSSMGVKMGVRSNEKMPGVPSSLIANSLIYGRISKKSQVLGKWEERFIVINGEGMYSYRKFNEKHSMFIQSGSVKELATRFEMQDGLLLIKLTYSNAKTEFGIPIENFLSKQNWLYHFYGMLK